MGGRPLGTRPSVLLEAQEGGPLLQAPGPARWARSGPWQLAMGRPGDPDSWDHRALHGVGSGCQVPSLGQ